MVMLAVLWLGSLAFYGDNVRRRCNFFADRGISPTQVWWTRLLLPALLALLLAAIAFGLPSYSQQMSSLGVLWILILVAFAFGQLVAQWVSRPVLAFFAGPAYMMVHGVLLFIVYAFYPGYEWTFLLIAPVLLFATWRMCGRWLEGRGGFGFHLRVVAYTALAVSIPLLLIFVDRTATTPSLRPAWRAQAMTVSNEFYPGKLPPNDGLGLTADGISTGVFFPYDFARVQHEFAIYDQTNQQQIAQALKEEFQSETMGDEISVFDLRIVFQSNYLKR